MRLRMGIALIVEHRDVGIQLRGAPAMLSRSTLSPPCGLHEGTASVAHAIVDGGADAIARIAPGGLHKLILDLVYITEREPNRGHSGRSGRAGGGRTGPPSDEAPRTVTQPLEVPEHRIVYRASVGQVSAIFCTDVTRRIGIFMSRP